MKTIVGILDSIRAHQKIGNGRNSRRHYTLLASDVDADTKAKIVMHELENAFVHKRFLEIDDLLKEMGYWLRINGVPETTLKDKQLSRFQRKNFLKMGSLLMHPLPRASSSRG